MNTTATIIICAIFIVPLLMMMLPALNGVVEGARTLRELLARRRG